MDIRLTISLLCSSQYREDELVCRIYDACGTDRDRAVMAYSRICEILCLSGQTLSEYIFRLAVRGSLVREYVKTGSGRLARAAGSDIENLSFLAAISSGELIGRIYEETVLDGIPTAEQPGYETGNTVITLGTVTQYIKTYGSEMFEKHKAFTVRDGKLVPAARYDDVKLSQLKNYRVQQRELIENTKCFVAGKPYRCALLYGDRGTGKSSTVKAAANEFDDIRVIFLTKENIREIYDIYEIIADNPLKFIIFLDDVVLERTDPGLGILKQALEGSVIPMPSNCVIYATTNRRHIVRETPTELGAEELHESDRRDENMSLSDRFGLFITFSSPGKSEYLDIVRQIASDMELDLPEEKLFLLAERFALKKAGRSPRNAKQAVELIASRLSLGLDPELV